MSLRSLLALPTLALIALGLSWGHSYAEPRDDSHVSEPPAHYNLGDVNMTLRRTTCFGSCPAYTLTIRGGGACTLRGNGRQPWTQEFSVDSTAAFNLLEDFYGADFFVLRKEYVESPWIRVSAGGNVVVLRGRITDMPHAFLTLSIMDYTRTIQTCCGFGPRSLQDIAERMDKLTDAKGRVQRQDQRDRSNLK